MNIDLFESRLAKWLLEKVREDIERTSVELSQEKRFQELKILDHSPRIEFLELRLEELNRLASRLSET